MGVKLKPFTKFLSIFFATIFLVRVWVLIVQERSLFLFGSEIHHLFIGILFVIISGFSRFFSHNKKLNLYDLELFAIGTGLIVDEYIFIVFTSGAHSDYFSSLSVIGTIIITGFFAIIFYSIYKLELHKKTKEKTK